MSDQKKSIESKIEQQKFLETLGSFFSACFPKIQYKFSFEQATSAGQPSPLRVNVVATDPAYKVNAHSLAEINALFQSLDILPVQSSPGRYVYDFKKIYEWPKLLNFLDNYRINGIKNEESQNFINNFNKLSDFVNFFNSNVLQSKDILKHPGLNDYEFFRISNNLFKGNFLSPNFLSSALLHFDMYYNVTPERINILKNFLREHGINLNSIQNENIQGFDIPFSELNKQKTELAPPSPIPSILSGFDRMTEGRGSNTANPDSNKNPNIKSSGPARKS